MNLLSQLKALNALLLTMLSIKDGLFLHLLLPELVNMFLSLVLVLLALLLLTNSTRQAI
jgi:hypothetical protein